MPTLSRAACSIAHRLSVVRQAHPIITIERGRDPTQVSGALAYDVHRGGDASSYIELPVIAH